MTALSGWLATFEAHVIDSAEARALADEITSLEGALAVARGKLQLSYVDESGKRVEAGVTKLGALLSTSSVESVRRSAWDGLRAIEPYVLDQGFLDVVRARNRSAGCSARKTTTTGRCAASRAFRSARSSSASTISKRRRATPAARDHGPAAQRRVTRRHCPGTCASPSPAI
jgi:hypothetical protein